MRFKKIEPILGKNPKKVSISNSEIQTFKSCRRRWFLGSYLGLQEKEKSHLGPLPLGTRVHNALEVFYRDGVDPVDEYNRLHRIDAKKFKESPQADDEKAVKKFNEEGELGRLMLEGYMDWLEDTNADDDIEYVSQEEQLRYTFENDSRVELIGKVDARIKRRSDGSLADLDFKTAAPSNFSYYLQYVEFSEQLKHYNLLEMLSNKDHKVDGGRYRVLKKVKRSGRAAPPFYADIDVRFNRKEMESFWIRITGTIRDIMAVRDGLDDGQDDRYLAYPSQKMDWVCGSCPFSKMCVMMDDGSDFEGYALDHFVQGDPNERYNDDDKETLNG